MQAACLQWNWGEVIELMYDTKAMTIATVALVLGLGALAGADSWNDRTTFTFSKAVRIPGATLEPGKYVFRLVDSQSARHVVEVIAEDDRTMVAMAQAIPTKRLDPKGDTVLEFAPTEQGPPVIKAWYYPGSLYGHEFVFSTEEARTIAARSKTLVLSTDVPGSDASQGVLHVVDASGALAAWRGDDATLKEWDAWRVAQRAARDDADDRNGDGPGAEAVMVESTFQAQRIELDELEEHHDRYIGKAVSVDGEVERVLGPRLFTIDEPNWIDLDGELLVLVPAPMAAFIREDDRVTVNGTVKSFVRADVERSWDWLDFDDEMAIELRDKAVLVADSVVGGDDRSVLAITTDDAGVETGQARAGRTGEHTELQHGQAAADLKSLAKVVEGDEDLIGRRVHLDSVNVAGTTEKGAFFAKHGDEYVLFVRDGARVLAEGSSQSHTNPRTMENQAVERGETVSITGIILEMPEDLRERIEAPGDLNEDIYVLLTRVGTSPS